jgi:hypothetical protein
LVDNPNKAYNGQKPIKLVNVKIIATISVIIARVPVRYPEK